MIEGAHFQNSWGWNIGLIWMNLMKDVLVRQDDFSENSRVGKWG